MRTIKGVCIITQDMPRLRDFYRAVLQVEPQGDDGFTGFATADVTLTLFPSAGMEQLAPGSMLGAGHGHWVLEFEVEDVDREHARLVALNVPIVKPPATHPWGMRSVWFRDPDGNLLDFFAPVAGVQPSAGTE